MRTSRYVVTEAMEKKRRAWEFLFKNKALEKIILEINGVWLDYRNPIVIKNDKEKQELRWAA